MQLEEAFENELTSPDPARRNLGQARKDVMQLRSSVSEAESLVQKARLETEKAIQEAKLEAKLKIEKAEFEAKLKIEKAIHETDLEAKKAAADLADAKLEILMKQGPTRLDVWLQERIEFSQSLTATCRGFTM
jgi:vacuolar-type H+-ATPase subunit H